MNVAADIERLARESGWADRPAYVAGERTWSHGDVHRLAGQAAAGLAQRGVGEGDRVLLALPDGIAWIAAFLAAARLGAVAVLVNPALTERELGELIGDCEPRLVIGGPTAAGGPPHVAGSELARAEGALSCPVDVSASAPLYVQYTSGTTGRPKGAEHRHGDIAPYHRAVGIEMLELGPDDVSLSVSKLFFAYGFGNSLVYPLLSGSSAVLLEDKPAPALIADLVERHRVTILHAVPSAYANLVAEVRDRSRFATLRAAVSAGEPLAPALGASAESLLGCPVLDELGCTEVGGAFCANQLRDNVPGTIGRALPDYELDVRDGGALWVRGPTVMSRYIGRPEETARALVDGWLRTGDRVVRNDDGTLTHAGRLDDLEMVGGITVSPVEVEHTLAAHAAVAEIAVAAVPDSRGATKLQAFVVPAGDAADAETVERELLEWARRRLAPFKVPRRVRFVRALPRTVTGKLRRYLLRDGRWHT